MMELVDVLDGDRRWSGDNPWTGDQILFSLSVWWVKMTNPDTLDFSSEVATVFDSLQRDLRRRKPRSAAAHPLAPEERTSSGRPSASRQ